MVARSTTVIVLAFAMVLTLHAQTSTTIRLKIDSSSTLELKGTSTLHNFECKSRTIEGSLAVDNNAMTFAEVNVTIPVKGIHSGNSSMDDNMYEALKAKDNPNITFSLISVDTRAIAGQGTPTQKDTVRGNLTIAGKTLPVDLVVKVAHSKNGTIGVEGSQDLLMTDFGIEPPSFMFGALKAGNKVTVDFNLILDPVNNGIAATSLK